MPTPLTACVRLGRLHLATLYAAGAQLTPRIERHPDALVLDLRGGEQLVLRLKGSWGPPSAAAMWPALAARLHERLRGAVLEARGDAEAVEQLRIGLAPTRTAAWLAAATLTTASGLHFNPNAWSLLAVSLLAMGVPRDPDVLLTVHGRKSRPTRAVPAAICEPAGKQEPCLARHANVSPDRRGWEPSAVLLSIPR